MIGARSPGRSVLYLALTALMLIAVAWTYMMSYAATDARAEVRALGRAIIAERQAIATLRGEWAYLNGPERLAEKARANSAELGLKPMTPEAFLPVDEIIARPFGPPAPPPDFEPAPQIAEAEPRGPFEPVLRAPEPRRRPQRDGGGVFASSGGALSSGAGAGADADVVAAGLSGAEAAGWVIE